MRYVIAYFATAIVMVVLDLAWLRYASDAVFRPNVGEMLTDDPNIIAAVLFYIFFAAGLVFFAVWPALKIGSAGTAILNGAILGFLAYMAFDLTNLAILRVWSVKVSIIDITWGTLVSGVSAYLGYVVTSRF